MVYRGLVRGGVVIFEGQVELPEGTAVTVEASTARGASRPSSDVAMEAYCREKADRHLGAMGCSSIEGMEAQRRLDRHL